MILAMRKKKKVKKLKKKPGTGEGKQNGDSEEEWVGFKGDGRVAAMSQME